MAYLNGGRIVLDGLVLALDAGDKNSYPGSGTTWSDYSGNGNNGTLTNGPSFSSGNGGKINFDSTDDYVNIPYNSSQNLTSQGTLSVWINPSTLTQSWYAGLISQSTGGSTNAQAYQLSWRQVSGALFGSICNGSGTYNDIFAPLPTVANVWYNIVFTWNGSLATMYNNGVQIGQIAQTINCQVLTTDLTIGGYTYKGAGGGAEYFNGAIANAFVYNRGLTAIEILQNYNATKSRFGLK